ncbi:MAG: nitrate reductase cytochrome c-type subunit [Gammaproteobacteria bacterium]|nr:nitrate reductase cytochrome c-type subunit [Gammaproteobacteria bacterium]
MMKHKRWIWLCAGMVLVVVMQSVSAESVRSLRESPIDAPSDSGAIIKWQHEADPKPRAYPFQPPLIPHRVEGYVVNLKFNKCLTCHSRANHKNAAATAVSPTHYYEYSGKKTEQVAGRRYFCLQCHVPQRDTSPLVENTFRSQ